MGNIWMFSDQIDEEDLNLSKRKTIDTLSELDDIGLIDRRRQGRGNPNMIYVKNFNRPVC